MIIAFIYYSEDIPAWFKNTINKISQNVNCKIILIISSINNNIDTSENNFTFIEKLFLKIDHFITKLKMTIKKKEYAFTIVTTLANKIELNIMGIKSDNIYILGNDENQTKTYIYADIIIQIGDYNYCLNETNIYYKEKYIIAYPFNFDGIADKYYKHTINKFITNKNKKRIISIYLKKDSIDIIEVNERIAGYALFSELLSDLFWKASEMLSIEIKRYVKSKYNYSHLVISAKFKNKHNYKKNNIKIMLLQLKILKYLLLVPKNIIFKEINKNTKFHIFYSFKNINPNNPININDFQILTSPKDSFWADPFLFKYKNEIYIFFEDYNYKKKYGVISYVKHIAGNKWSSKKIILNEGYHLSYPFIFEYKDNIYMIPETRAANQIKLYKCVQFPDKWEFDKILIDNISAVDTTLYFIDDKIFLFTSVRTNQNTNDDSELYIYMAEHLYGKWALHPMSPVSYNVLNARCAGRIFNYNNTLLRPAQIGKSYGWGISLQEIISINENKFSESSYRNMTPNNIRSIKGIHTFNYSEEMTVIDCICSRRISKEIKTYI